MLTKLLEDGKAKCVQYWPDHGKNLKIAGLIIENKETRDRDGYTVTTFHVKLQKVLCHFTKVKCLYPNIIIHQSDRKPRVVKHYWMNSWPDHGVPHSTESTLSLLHEVYEDRQANVVAPVVVHCSAGCGLENAICGLLV